MNTRTRKTKRNHKKNPKKSRNNTDGWNVQSSALTRLPRTVNVIMPDKLMTRLSYKGVGVFTIAAAAQVFARRWTPTAAYDVDPLLGSTTMVGYTEMAAFYDVYRVAKSSVTARFANITTTPLQAIVIPLNKDPGTTPSAVTVQEWINNAYGKVKLIPNTGGPVTSISSRMSTEKIYGSKMVYFDDNFASATNAIPANNWFWAIAISAAVPVGGATSVIVETDFIIDVEFYSRKNMNS